MQTNYLLSIHLGISCFFEIEFRFDSAKIKFIELNQTYL